MHPLGLVLRVFDALLRRLIVTHRIGRGVGRWRGSWSWFAWGSNQAGLEVVALWLLTDHLVSVGLATPDRRPLLLARLPPMLVGSLPVKERPREQMFSDLIHLYPVADALLPWLANAAKLLGDRSDPVFCLLRRLLEARVRAAGAPSPSSAAGAMAVPDVEVSRRQVSPRRFVFEVRVGRGGFSVVWMASPIHAARRFTSRGGGRRRGGSCRRG